MIVSFLEWRIGFSLVLVELEFWRYWWRWPLAVLVDLGRCFRTSSEVRCGHEVKKPTSMASHDKIGPLC